MYANVLCRCLVYELCSKCGAQLKKLEFQDRKRSLQRHDCTKKMNMRGAKALSACSDKDSQADADLSEPAMDQSLYDGGVPIEEVSHGEQNMVADRIVAPRERLAQGIVG